ncbi:MAG: hypothetical protein EOP83_27425 [Verrucomicrobiaceae bacterium]|nr:MAG: hypothetical protein EOP83_27425 [Verrucomicrobiaceae bacterium]
MAVQSERIFKTLRSTVQISDRLASSAIPGQLERVNGPVGQSSDIGALWDKTAERLRNMPPDERRDTLVAAGILTPAGRVRKPYRRGVQIRKTPRA